jgi:hypothetical protein
MLDEATKKAVADYVLDQNDPERLKLLVTMHDSWETIRLQVINEFAKQFARTISDALPASDGWFVDAEQLLTGPLKQYTGLETHRSTWDKGLRVGINAQSWGAFNWIIGVWGEEGYHHERLPAVLVEKSGPGKKSPTWPWYRFFYETSEFGHWEFGDWRTGTAIIALREGAAGYYSKRLCEKDC